MNEHQVDKIPVGVSACLLGEEVRFNGGHKFHSYIDKTLGEYFSFRTFCPEVDIGLGIPRRPIRLIRRDGDVTCVDFEDDQLDYTQALIASADAQRSWQAGLCGFILKKDSPSCGMERAKVYDGKQTVRDGVGIFAERLMQNFPELPVEEEGRLGDAVLRENFIQRVYVMHRWRQLTSAGITVASLTDFHARHKLILMSHCQKTYRELGPVLASARKDTVAELAPRYIGILMSALKKRASRGDHVNVLQHIQGYLRDHLDTDDRAELVDALQRYRLGQLPLIVPITLLNHHFRKHPNDYISRSWYMHPYPPQMSLQNHI
ncbi:hypothetical protein PHACT_14455 [Pseudohongiella acticola]|uniref:DUF1722 domain-containing protein n=1 Tax=Pseudohongiella acticola TaxID=1524254 RepID=A0A1E8CFE1_9GAMM|nr:DUF523 and DUF1722 domain-containing protein [Pseudohongiella acticola]OFE11066.1 hypothetical protein PHACT_14455 [Pseudohongiella acticola]